MKPLDTWQLLNMTKVNVEIVRHHERGENFTLLFLFKENIIQNQSSLVVDV